jgi:hypothetical protein
MCPTRRLACALFAFCAAVSVCFTERLPVLRQIDLPHPYYFREMYLPQLTSGPSSLAWSPDSRELIYSMAGSLFATRLCADAGKTPIRVKDVAGFAVNRVLHAFMIEAVRLVEEGVASGLSALRTPWWNQCFGLSGGRAFDILKHTFHGIHARDIIPGVMISASFAFPQPQPAPDVGVARACAAEVDYRGQFLNARRGRGFHMIPL